MRNKSTLKIIFTASHLPILSWRATVLVVFGSIVGRFLNLHTHTHNAKTWLCYPELHQPALGIFFPHLAPQFWCNRKLLDKCNTPEMNMSCKISNLMTTEFSFIRMFLNKQGSLLTRSFKCKHLFVFKHRFSGTCKKLAPGNPATFFTVLLRVVTVSNILCSGTTKWRAKFAQKNFLECYGA